MEATGFVVFALGVDLSDRLTHPSLNLFICAIEPAAAAEIFSGVRRPLAAHVLRKFC